MGKQVEEKKADQIEMLLDEKFIKGSTAEQKEFLEIIKGWRKSHIKSAHENKENYFQKNVILISLLSGNKIVNMFIAILGTVVASIGISEVIIKCLEFLKIVKEDTIFTGLVITLMFIIYMGIVYFNYTLTEKQKELELKRYGETWVRHTVALYNYNQEILKYVYELDYYGDASEEEQRKVFMEKLLAIEAENMNKFDENMKNLQEYVK